MVQAADMRGVDRGRSRCQRAFVLFGEAGDADRRYQYVSQTGRKSRRAERARGRVTAGSDEFLRSRGMRTQGWLQRVFIGGAPSTSTKSPVISPEKPIRHDMSVEVQSHLGDLHALRMCESSDGF